MFFLIVVGECMKVVNLQLENVTSLGGLITLRREHKYSEALPMIDQHIYNYIPSRYQDLLVLRHQMPKKYKNKRRVLK